MWPKTALNVDSMFYKRNSLKLHTGSDSREGEGQRWEVQCEGREKGERGEGRGEGIQEGIQTVDEAVKVGAGKVESH